MIQFLKEKKVNISPINSSELNKLSEDFEKCFVPNKELSAEQAFWLPLSNPKSEQLVVAHTPVEIEVPKELPKDFDNSLHNEINEVKTVFNQMEVAVEQYVMNIVMHVDSIPVNVLPANNKCLVNDSLEFERLKQENDHLFKLLLSQDTVYICVNSLATRTNCYEMQQSFIDAYNETLELKAQLAKKEHMVEKIVFNEVVLRCSRIKNWCVNLELKLQHQKETKLKAKDVSIANLKKHNESLKGKNVVEKDIPPNNAKERADTLRELVEHARALRPLYSDLDSACGPNRLVVPGLRFGNDQIAKIMGYGDYQMGNVTISRVYYMEGLGHNLFSVGQFCDFNLEVAFRKHTCYIRDLEGVDLLKGSRGSNLYTLSLEDMMLLVLDIRQKDKRHIKKDKTEHGIGKSGKVKVKVNPDKVNSQSQRRNRRNT
ncbi:hypothetical protein Tco_0692103 [Tanacetum coccineum]